MNYYTLQDKKPVKVESYEEWKRWVERANREVRRDELQNGVIVVTVFVGQAECMDETQEPLLFETMIRGGIHDGIVQQFATWEQAEEGHEKALQLVSTE